VTSGRRRSHSPLAEFAAVALLGSFVLTGCSPVGVDGDHDAPTPSSAATTPPTETPRQASYEKAIREWTLSLPEGYDWPERVPEDYAAGGTAMTGEQVVRRVWGCAVIDSAWKLFPTDREQAAAQLDLLQQDRESWDLPYGSDDWTDNARTAGDSGLCLQWIDGGYIEYP